MRPNVFVYYTHVDSKLCVPPDFDPQRLEQLCQMTHPKAFAASLAGDLLLCHAVRTHMPGAPFPLRRAVHSGGKPYLADLPDIHFSISHSGGEVVCALSETAVGIDLELPRPMRPGIAARYFTPREQEILTRNPSAFFEMWMAKEAVLKEIGCGIAAGLHEVSVSCSPRLRLTAPVFGQWHTLTLAELPGGLRAVVSTPGRISPKVWVRSHTL